MNKCETIKLTKDFYGKLRQVRDNFYTTVTELKQFRFNVRKDKQPPPLVCLSGTQPNCVLLSLQGKDAIEKELTVCIEQTAKSAFLVAMMHLEDYLGDLLTVKGGNEDSGKCEERSPGFKDLLRKAAKKYDFEKQDKDALPRVDHLRVLRNAVTHDNCCLSKRGSNDLLPKSRQLCAQDGTGIFLPASSKDGRFVKPGERFTLEYSHLEGILLCLCEFGAAILGNDPWDVPDWALYALWVRREKPGKCWPSENSYKRAQELANSLGWMPGKPPHFDEWDPHALRVSKGQETED